MPSPRLRVSPASNKRKAVTMSTKTKLITMFCVPLIVVSAFSADWPQYYGPSRNSTSTEKGLLRTWPNDGPKVLWTAPLGIGFGGPAVSAGKVYLLDRDDKVGDTLRVYELSNGKELWNFAYAGPGKVEFPGSRTTPTVDGDRVYTVGMVGDLYCISTTTQKPVWHKNIWTDFGGGSGVPATPFSPPMEGGQVPIWGIVQNPLIYRNLLIVASQAPQAGVVAYDKATGDIKWKTAPLSGTTSQSSPLKAWPEFQEVAFLIGRFSVLHFTPTSASRFLDLENHHNLAWRKSMSLTVSSAK